MGRFRNIRHKYKWLDYTVEIDRTMVIRRSFLKAGRVLEVKDQEAVVFAPS